MHTAHHNTCTADHNTYIGDQNSLECHTAPASEISNGPKNEIVCPLPLHQNLLTSNNQNTAQSELPTTYNAYQLHYQEVNNDDIICMQQHNKLT